MVEYLQKLEISDFLVLLLSKDNWNHISGGRSSFLCFIAAVCLA